MLNPNEFDAECSIFSASLRNAANWKHVYLGAAYHTRLRAAMVEAQEAINRMRDVLERDAQ